MAKYRGFVGQVAPLGALRTTILNGERTGYYRYPTTFTTNKVTPYIAPTTEPAPILEPIKTGGYIYDPSQQEITAPQYVEGGDGTATEIERTAKIDEAMERLKEQTVGFEPWLTPGTPEYAARLAKEAAVAKPEMPALLPLAIGAGLIWLMS